MASINFIKPERVPLLKHPTLNEKWVQDRIAEDPGILGLGPLIVKDKERNQLRAGRLDLLLQDPDTDRRYEVEIQLGKTDESHIIRTIEYWDIERRRYPQYEHCAVIVAEDITSRFLNVVGLFNGHIPLIAIKMSAKKWGDQIALDFTTVYDELPHALVDGVEDAEAVPTDRGYWEARASKATLAMADELLKLIHSFAPGYQLNYNKSYIVLRGGADGITDNFVVFLPKRAHLLMFPRLPEEEETRKLIVDAGLDLMGYDKGWGRYKVRLVEADVHQQRETLTKLLQMAHQGDEGNVATQG
jgi:hypothetical protein